MTKKMKNKLKRITIYISLLIISIILTFNLKNLIIKYANSYNNSVNITISSVGDCTFGNYKGANYANSFDSEVKSQNFNFDYFFENVKNIFEKDDLSIVNLEGPLTNSNNFVEKKFAFKGNPEYVNILKNSSIEAVNLANNHSLDYGQTGYIDTKNILNINNIKYFGNEENKIIDVKGVKIALLGYKGWNDTSEFREKLKKDIDNANQRSDLIIISFHWGNENTYIPNDVQKNLGRFVVDSGADLVLGHHPHVVQGIENYKGKYIVYSLGNFCFGGNKNPRDTDTFIFRQTFTVNKGLENTSVIEVIPCRISSLNSRNNYKPVILKGVERDRVLKKIDNLSKKII